MKKLYIISLFIISSYLTGCYTQLATRDYEREDFGMEQESTLDSAEYYDTLFAESDTVYYDTVYVDEDAEIYDDVYADYPVGETVVYPEIIYVGGGYYRPYWSYWYYPWDFYSPGCLVPGYWPAWYPGYCGTSFYYYDNYYDPYYYGGYYGYVYSDPKYKYRTNSTHNSRLRDNDGGRTTTRTRDGIRTGGFAGRTTSINSGSSVGKSRTVGVDNEIGKPRGSTGINRNVKEARPVSTSGSSRTIVAIGNKGSNEVKNVHQVKNQDKKNSIKNKSYNGTRRKVIVKSKSGSRTSIRSGSKIYKPSKKTSGSSSVRRVYKPSNKTGESSKSYRSKSSRSGTKSYSSPKSSGRSSSSKSYRSPNRGSSSRSTYSPRSSGSSSRSSARSSSSRSGGSRSSGRSSGKSRR